MGWHRRLSCAIAAGLAGGLLLAVSSCERKPADVWPEKPGPRVLTSFAPLYCFALNVAGDDAVVKALMTTKGPHDLSEPTEQHLKLAAKADVLFLNGLGIDEKFAEKIKSSVKPDLNIFALGSRLGQDDLLEGECKHEHHKAGEKHVHPTDPHVWLGPKQAKKMVAMIRDELTRIDPSHAAGYASRAEAYIARLDQLERDGKEMLKGKTERQILSHHDSMQYFTDAFGLVIAGYITYEGIEPGAERLNKIIKDCKTYGCRIIAVEPQYPRNSAAQTILTALKNGGVKDAEFVEVDPMETADEKDLTPDFYERKMRQNLKNLAIALR